jgi:hypothetical protein
MATATTFATVGGPAPLRATSEWAELERRLRLAAKHLLGAAVGGRQVSTPAHPTNQWS